MIVNFLPQVIHVSPYVHVVLNLGLCRFATLRVAHAQLIHIAGCEVRRRQALLPRLSSLLTVIGKKRNLIKQWYPRDIFVLEHLTAVVNFSSIGHSG